MELNMPHELDELITCSFCFQAFNETDFVPKLLNCRHYFCLKCVNSLLHEGGEEIHCLHCWKPTELPKPGCIDSLPNHNSIIFLRQNLHGLYMNTTTRNTVAAVAVDEVPTTSASARANGVSSSSGSGSGSSTIHATWHERQRSASTASNGSLGELSGHSSVQQQQQQQQALNVTETGVGNEFGTNNLCSNLQALLLGINGGGGGGGVVNNNSSSNKFSLTNLNLCDRPPRNENCMTHAMPNSLWCTNCKQLLCRACATTDNHRNHTVKNSLEARDELQNYILTELHGMQRTLNEVQHMTFKHRDFLLKILENLSVLKTQIESEIVNNVPTLEIAGIRESLTRARLCLDMFDKQSPVEAHRLHTMMEREKERLNSKYREMFSRTKLDNLIGNCKYVIDFDMMTQIQEQSVTIHCGADESLAAAGAISVATDNAPQPNAAQLNPFLLLANYCISKSYSQQKFTPNQHKQQQQFYQPTAPLLTNGILNAMISNGKANINCVNDGGTDVNFENASYVQHDTTNGSNQQLSPGAGTSQQHQRRTYADIANSMPSTSAAASIVKTNLQQHQNQNRHHQQQERQQQQQQKFMFSPPQSGQQQQQEPIDHKAESSKSSSLSGYSELAPIGTPPGGGNSNMNNNQHVVTIPNVAAQLFSKSDFTSLDLSLLSFQQPSTTNSVPQHLPGNNHQQQHRQQQHSQQHLRQHQHQQQQLQQQHQQQLQKLRWAHQKSQQQHRPPLKLQKYQGSTPSVGMLLNPSQHLYPMYFFNVEINGQEAGTFVIEVLNDIAPKMAKNFHALATHEYGYGYKGCQIFQCWENESIITGDFELNNGRGGRAVYEAGHFIPDETKIMAVRGCVGMRRTQKRHDNMGSVGSQFRIILREMRGFTGIFGRIIEGIDLIEKIAQTGDNTGKPHSNVFITNCGKYVLA